MQWQTDGLSITGGIHTTGSDSQLRFSAWFFWLSPHIHIPVEEDKPAQDKEVNVEIAATPVLRNMWADDGIGRIALLDQEELGRLLSSAERNIWHVVRAVVTKTFKDPTFQRVILIHNGAEIRLLWLRITSLKTCHCHICRSAVTIHHSFISTYIGGLNPVWQHPVSCVHIYCLLMFFTDPICATWEEEKGNCPTGTMWCESNHREQLN